MIVNNQVKQLIKITILLECKGYFSQHLAPTRYSPGAFKDFFVQTVLCTKSSFEEREKERTV